MSTRQTLSSTFLFAVIILFVSNISTSATTIINQDYRLIDTVYQTWEAPATWGRISDTIEQAANDGCESWTTFWNALGRVVEPKCDPINISAHPYDPTLQQVKYSYKWNINTYNTSFDIKTILQCTEAPFLTRQDHYKS